MRTDTAVHEQILNIVHRMPDCTLEEVVTALPDSSWREIFLEVDRLSRLGAIQLTSRGVGSYTIRLRAV